MTRTEYLTNLSYLVDRAAPLDDFLNLYEKVFGIFPKEQVIKGYRTLVNGEDVNQLSESASYDYESSFQPSY